MSGATKTPRPFSVASYIRALESVGYSLTAFGVDPAKHSWLMTSEPPVSTTATARRGALKWMSRFHEAGDEAMRSLIHELVKRGQWVKHDVYPETSPLEVRARQAAAERRTAV